MTQSEIAKKVGISQSSVSHVLTDPATTRVSKAKKQLIVKLVKSSGRLCGPYRRMTWNIGYILDSLQNIRDDFYARSFAGVEELAADYHYNVIVECWRGSKPNMFNRKNVDGVIIRSGAAWKNMRGQQIGVPVVLLNCSGPELNCDVVMPDNRGGMFKAVKFLHERGCNQPVFLGARPDYSIYSCNYAERQDGFLEAARMYGMRTSELCTEGPVSGKAIAYIDAFLKERKGNYDSIISVNYLYAALARKLQPEIPIVAGDNKHTDECPAGNFAVLEMDVFTMGKIAVETLTKRLFSPERPFVKIICGMNLNRSDSHENH